MKVIKEKIPIIRPSITISKIEYVNDAVEMGGEANVMTIFIDLKNNLRHTRSRNLRWPLPVVRELFTWHLCRGYSGRG